MTSFQADQAAQAHQLALQGAALFQAGQTTQAREACFAAWQLAPHSCEVMLLLAFIELRANQPLAAIGWLDRTLAENAELADAYFLRGEAQQMAGQHEAAVASYDELLRRKPDHADALNNRGNAYQALTQHVRALHDYERAIALKPDEASFHNNRGLAIRALGDHAQAMDCFRQAIALQPDYGLAHFNLGLSLFALHRYHEALASHDDAARLMPAHGASHWGRADALRAMGDYEASKASYDTAIALEPRNADIYNNRGLLQHFSGRHNEALSDFTHATDLDPSHADAHCNHGMAWEALGRHETALSHYDKALSHAPTHAAAHFNRALCDLTLGDYREGWAEYEWRWQTEQLKSSAFVSQAPLWLGKESLKGKRILVHAEQGLGDSLQFCRYLPLLADLGATVIVQIQAPLVSLIARLRGVTQVVTPGETLPAFDLHCPFMSLPLAFGTTLETVPSAARYLSPSSGKLEDWKQRLGKQHGLRVGLVWAGAPHGSLAVQRPVDVRRSIPLTHFAPLNLPGVTFYSLQKGESAASQLQACEKAHWNGPVIQDHSADLHDFDDTAALIEQLDLVISVDTSVAHLAGALGKPVWLLNRFDTCWRWMTQRDDSPWYRSMKIFRQPAPGDWHSVIVQVRDELQRLANA